MDWLPPYWTLPIGCLVGVMVTSPISRWLVFFLRATGIVSERVGGIPKGDRAIPTVFATLLHPVPWILLFGLPYLLYRLWSNPPSLQWRWFFVGWAIGPLVLMLWVYIVIRRIRRRKAAHETAPRADS
jgi:hypothetical protein